MSAKAFFFLSFFSTIKQFLSRNCMTVGSFSTNTWQEAKPSAASLAPLEQGLEATLLPHDGDFQHSIRNVKKATHSREWAQTAVTSGN